MTCYRCGAPVHENWEKMPRADREMLKAALGIKPLCSECVFRDFWEGPTTVKVKEGELNVRDYQADGC